MINSLKICSNSPVISLTWWFLLCVVLSLGLFQMAGSASLAVLPSQFFWSHFWKIIFLSSYFMLSICLPFLFFFSPSVFIYYYYQQQQLDHLFSLCIFSKMEIKLYIKFRMHNSYIRFGVTLSIFVSVVGKQVLHLQSKTF